MKKSLLILSILMMCLIYMPSEIYAEDVLIETNKCSDESEDLIYSAYDTDNDNIVDKLVISGTGAFTKLDYQYNGINTVVFEEGVTSIEYGIDCKELYVPKSVTLIKGEVFGFISTLSPYKEMVEGCFISGYSGSAAHQYAMEHYLTFINVEGEFKEEDGNLYWYEDGVKQGVRYDADGNVDSSFRGHEIYDMKTGQWYWLDGQNQGAVAKSKDVYQYSLAGSWGDEYLGGNNHDDMHEYIGKWVRYDSDGCMIKGWCVGKGADAKRIESPDNYLSEDVYYFDKTYGTMAKGIVNIDGKIYCFDPVTGVLQENREVLVKTYSFGYPDIITGQLYDINGDNVGDKLVISGNGKMHNYTVTMGRRPWENEKDNIKILVIEDGITSVGTINRAGTSEGFFEGMPLISVTLPESVNTIGTRAFMDCNKLESIVIPQGVEIIADKVFFRCKGLKEITLPDTLKEIQSEAFDSCCSLKDLRIPKNVTVLPDTLGCMNYGKAFPRIVGFKIYGYEGSIAEEYANKKRITFIKIKEGWITTDNVPYWYENGIKQGTYDDAKNVVGDGIVRGREIYDSESDGWYWLDASNDGAKATNKEVWMPYIYQQDDTWSDTEIAMNASNSGDMAAQVTKAIQEKTGKWVRYDSAGKMIKGWYTVEGEDAAIYPQQAGNTYYYDSMTGLMAKGKVTIDGVEYNFDEITGALLK